MTEQIKIRYHDGQIVIWPKEPIDPKKIDSIIENKSVLSNDVIRQMMSYLFSLVNGAKILDEYEVFAKRSYLNKEDIETLINNGQLALPYSLHTTDFFAQDYLITNNFASIYQQWCIAHNLSDWPVKSDQEMKKEVADNFYTCLSNNRYCCYNFETQLEDK